MKFSINTAKYFYSDKKEIKSLEKMGFKFKDYKGMKTISDCDNVIVEIKGLKALMKFIEKYGQIILGGSSIRGKDIIDLTIYNDYTI